jgi:SAM-dependent methyltransferase
MSPLRGRAEWARWLLGRYRPEDRRVLEDVVLARYRDNPEFPRILFVGVAGYVRHYPAMFPRQDFVTIDPSLRRALFGSRLHIRDRVENLGAYFPPEHFDAAILNGVIGWGLDDLASVDRALAVCHRHLRAGGELLLSTDADKPCHGRLDQVGALASGFVPRPLPSLGTPQHTTHVPWHEKSEHVFLFFQKR